MRSLRLLFRLEDNHQDPKIDDKPKENPIHNEPKIRAGLRVRVKVDDNPKEDVTNVFGKIDLGRKMKGHSEERQRLREVLKVTEERLSSSEMRTYKSLCDDFKHKKIEYRKLLRSILPLVKKYQRFVEIDKEKPKRFTKVTPSYGLIPEEEQSPVSTTVLNNKCVLMEVDYTQKDKKLTSYEEEMNTYEDYMYQTDMLMETLRSAMENAEKVMRGEMRLEDIGVKFYRCAEQLYGGDMFDIVRDDPQRALPVILKRLNQKLLEVTTFGERCKPTWKQAVKEISAKQKDSTTQSHMKK